MVKNKNYNHPEVAILREADLQRIKVYHNNISRKLYANQLSKN